MGVFGVGMVFAMCIRRTNRKRAQPNKLKQLRHELCSLLKSCRTKQIGMLGLQLAKPWPGYPPPYMGAGKAKPTHPVT